MFFDLHEPLRVLIWMSLAFKESYPLVRKHDLHLAPRLVVDESVQGTVGANPKSRAIAEIIGPKKMGMHVPQLNLGKMNDLPIFRKSGGGRGLKILLVLSWVFLQR